MIARMGPTTGSITRPAMPRIREASAFPLVSPGAAGMAAETPEPSLLAPHVPQKSAPAANGRPHLWQYAGRSVILGAPSWVRLLLACHHPTPGSQRRRRAAGRRRSISRQAHESSMGVPVRDSLVDAHTRRGSAASRVFADARSQGPRTARSRMGTSTCSRLQATSAGIWPKGAATAASVSNTIASEGRAPGHGENTRSSRAPPRRCREHRPPRPWPRARRVHRRDTPRTAQSRVPGWAGRRRVDALRVAAARRTLPPRRRAARRTASTSPHPTPAPAPT